jgi:hypothetical protein
VGVRVALTYLLPTRSRTIHLFRPSLSLWHPPTHTLIHISHTVTLTQPSQSNCTCPCASGGAYLGFYHIGVVKALFLEGLLPRVVRCVTLSFDLCHSLPLSISQRFPVYVSLSLPHSPFPSVSFFLPHSCAICFNHYFKISPVFLCISVSFSTPLHTTPLLFIYFRSSFSSLSLSFLCLSFLSLFISPSPVYSAVLLLGLWWRPW